MATAIMSKGNRVRFISSMALYRFFKVGQHNGFLVSKLNATKPESVLVGAVAEKS